MNRWKRYWKSCKHRCRGFLIRMGILLMSVLAILIVMANTGEVITLAIASERIAEVVGAAAADTLAE